MAKQEHHLRAENVEKERKKEKRKERQSTTDHELFFANVCNFRKKLSPQRELE